MIEQWKPIEGSNGMYEVSNTGKVRSTNYNKSGLTRELKQKINRYGYCVVTIHMEGKQKYPTVHRLVANAFIPNPDNKPQVNHKSGIKTDNSVDNLEWSTVSENVQHAFDSGLKEASIIHARDTILAYNETCKKPITAISLFDDEVLHFDSIKEASAATGVKDVSKPLRKTTLTANGYCFEYGNLNTEEADRARKFVKDTLGEKRFNSFRKRIVTKRGDADATNDY